MCQKVLCILDIMLYFYKPLDGVFHKKKKGKKEEGEFGLFFIKRRKKEEGEFGLGFSSNQTGDFVSFIFLRKNPLY